MEGIKKRVFYIFIVLHAIFWTLLQLIRNTMSIDSMEAIQWGALLSFGTNKHPPFSGWLIAGFYNLFGRYEVLAYLLGQLCLLLGFIFIYKTAKFFMTKEKAFCASMILEFCFYYTYGIFIDNYNCNIVLMGLIPAITYYFYKAVNNDKIKNWILFGILSGIAFLTKYQIAFVFMGMFLYILFVNREQFKKKGMYLAIFTGLVVILPHILWLYQNDFFSFAYMIERTDSETRNMPFLLAKLGHLTYPIKFILDQILAILPCFVVYIFLMFQSGKDLSLHASAKTEFIMNFENLLSEKVDLKNKNSIFLLCTGIIPILLLGFMGVITGSRVPGIWGSAMVSMAGILIFYFLPIKFNKDSYKYFVKWCYFGLFASLLAVGIFGILQTKYFIAYPYKQVMTDFDKIWAQESNNAPLKYAAGNLRNSFHFNIHNKHKATILLESFGHKNPWINHQDVIKSGAIIVGEDEQDVITRTKETIYLLPKDYDIIVKNYKIQLCNKIGKCKDSEFFYTIIPPEK